MPSARITEFHCDTCATQMINRLIKKTKAPEGSIHYDEASSTLTWPDSVDTRTVRRLLAADKIKILPDGVEPRTSAHDHDHDHDHDHGHAHGGKRGHSHSHAHDHAGMSDSKRIGGVFILNFGFSMFEFVAGAALNSVAIQSDAVHDLGDALSIGLAWIFERVSRKHSNHRFSFGYRRFSLLGALITALVLVVGSASMLLQSVPRLFNPEPVSYRSMTWIAILAVIINVVAAFLLRGSKSRNANILNLHMLEDMLGWIGILVISLVMRWRPLYILDPIFSILIAAFILWNAIPELIRTIRIMLESVPEGVDMAKIERQIASVPGVHGINHLHVWTLDGERSNLNVTLFTELATVEEQEKIKEQVAAKLAPYNLSCSTIQIDYDPDRLSVGCCSHESEKPA